MMPSITAIANTGAVLMSRRIPRAYGRRIMMSINIYKLITACDTVARRCTEIPRGQLHYTHTARSPWLFDQCMRAFDHPAVEAVFYEVFIGYPVNEPGEATIHQDGSLEMRRKP